MTELHNLCDEPLSDFLERIDWSFVKKAVITKTVDGKFWAELTHYRSGRFCEMTTNSNQQPAQNICSAKSGYKAGTQTEKNLCWMLPRPKPDHYKGGMPLYCEEWLINLAQDILGVPEAAVLNVFCGMNRIGFRVDMNPEVNPDILCDIHKLSTIREHVDMNLSTGYMFDIILADPPYSDEETDQLYGKHLPRLNYSKWTKECDKFLRPGGLLIVYHKFLVPNPDPEKYSVVKRVSILNRTWHLGRVAVYFQKKSKV